MFPYPPSDWRNALAAFNPVLARSPATSQAAEILLAQRKHVEAEEALRELLDQTPDDLKGLRTLSLLMQRLGRVQESAEVMTRVAWVEAGQYQVPSENRSEVGQFFSAAYQCDAPPAVAPASYVANLFDGYAENFDDHLRNTLSYRAPELLFQAISKLPGPDFRDRDILDLGCGTGLAGELFRAVARKLDGVDLSAKMLAQADAKRLYDRLIEGEVVRYLEETRERYHRILAADVFVYLGDLTALFTAAHRVLHPGGWFAFTAEVGDGDDFHLQPNRRYAHSREYLIRTTEVAGLAFVSLDEDFTRIEREQPVRSFIGVFTHPQGDATSTHP